MTHNQSQEWKARVIRNQAFSDGYALLRLALPKSFPKTRAGSFCMISTGNSREILLRRPMAFFDVEREKSHTRVDILYRVVGKGTRELLHVEPKSELSLLGPIGNFFSQPAKKDYYLVAAGGIGISPFLLWSRQLSASQKKRAKLLFGFPNEGPTSLGKLYRASGLMPVCAVEKAKTSFRGTVVDLLAKEFNLRPATRILTCGPEPMMEAVRQFAREKGVPCELSMEARMACGMGVCLSCVTSCAKEDGGDYALVCQDGPVFTYLP